MSTTVSQPEEAVGTSLLQRHVAPQAYLAHVQILTTEQIPDYHHQNPIPLETTARRSKIQSYLMLSLKDRSSVLGL